MEKKEQLNLLWSEFVKKINSDWEKIYKKEFDMSLDEVIGKYGNQTSFASKVREEIEKKVPLGSDLSVKTLHSYFQNGKLPIGIQLKTLDFICKYLGYHSFASFTKAKESERKNTQIEVATNPSKPSETQLPVDTSVPEQFEPNGVKGLVKRPQWPLNVFVVGVVITLIVASIVMYLKWSVSSKDLEIDLESFRRYLPKELIENRYYEASTETIQKQEFLKFLTYLDVKVHDKKVYALAAMIAENGKDNRIKDPDMTDYNEYNIYVISIDRYKIRVLQYPNSYHVRHGAIDIDDKYVHVFTQTKIEGEYNFIGTIHSIGKIEFINYHHAQTVFESDNRGLRPFFKNGKVHHFSAAGYYYCINDSTVKKITDKEFCEINQREISAYSDGILDSMSDFMQTMKSSESNGNVIFDRVVKYIGKNF